MSDQDQYDTIIIGAGIGGLTTGNFLAKSGQKVLILEKHSKVGGYVTSFEYKGCPVDVVHAIGGLSEGGSLDDIFRSLNLYNRVHFYPMEKVFLYKFPGYSISCYSDIEKYKDELKNNFPEEAEDIDSIIKELVSVWQEEVATWYAPSYIQWASFPLRFPRLVKYQSWTFEQFLSQFTNSYKLKKIISAGWPCLGLNMGRVSALYMVGMLMSYHMGGAWYPKGGFQKLSDAFAENFKSFGGTIMLNTNVYKIIFSNKIAVGVRTKKGDEFFAKNIVSNADTKKTFLDLCDERVVPKKLRGEIEGLTQSVSGVLVHLVVDMDLPKELSCGRIFYSPDFDTDEHQFKLYDQGKVEMDPNLFGLTVIVPALKNKDFVPGGQHLVQLVYTPGSHELFSKCSKPEYLALKENISNKMIQAAENVIPGLGKHILFKDVSTPCTYERYTGAVAGGWYDIDCSPRQVLFNRSKNKTPIKGLYLTGAKTFLGPGMFGAIHAGLYTADLILKGKLTGGGFMLRDIEVGGK